jgi:hypothetical protein
VSKPARKPEPSITAAEVQARREEIIRRLAEQGVIVQMPAAEPWVPPPEPFPASADELSGAVIRMRRGEGLACVEASHPYSKGNQMSRPAAPGEPVLDHSPELLEFQRRMAERGVLVQLPAPGAEWELPEPLPIDADEASRAVVELRRLGKL